MPVIPAVMVGMDKTVTELAKEKTAADRAFGKAFRAHLRTFEPLEISRFWEVVDQLQLHIGRRLSYGGVKDGAHNLICQEVYQATDEMSAWGDMARFLARYEDIKTRLSIKMDRLPGLDRGDDGFGDLIDSLPLAGPEVFIAIMADDVANGKQLDKAVIAHPLAKFILEGENYICMTFEKALKKSFVHVSRED